MMYSFEVPAALYIPGSAPAAMGADAERPRKEPVMPRSAMSRAALLLVLVLFAVPALQAAPNRAEAGPVPSAAAVPAAWDLFTQVWDFLTGVWSANGCGLDPSGGCHPRPITTDTDNGCGLDPSGGCGN
jgi:hypothetical protein